MPNWSEVYKEIAVTETTDALDIVRNKYLSELQTLTDRNVIAYYSGWLQHPEGNFSMNQSDMNALMQVIHGMKAKNRSCTKKGLDLILHTPGGELTPTEAIVNYLKEMFGNDIRAIVPEIAMSAGTMTACACKAIIMGKHSSIGPIDPQINGQPAYGIIAGFQDAIKKTKETPESTPFYGAMVSKYDSTFLYECQKAIELSDEIVRNWLEENMCSGDANKATQIVNSINNHEYSKTHSRRFSSKKAKEIGLTIIDLEDNHDFQDLVMTVHHAFIHTFMCSPTAKIIESPVSRVKFGTPRS